jgi:hypothetical protein
MPVTTISINHDQLFYSKWMDYIPFRPIFAQIIGWFITNREWIYVDWATNKEIDTMRKNGLNRYKRVQKNIGGITLVFSGKKYPYLIFLNSTYAKKNKKNKNLQWYLWSIYLHELAHTRKRVKEEELKGKSHGIDFMIAYMGLVRRAEGLFWFLGY